MMPFDEGKQIQQLIKLYRQGFEEILRIIIQKEARGQWTAYYKAILQDVYDILSQLDDNTQQWIQQTIGQVYSQNAAQVMAYLNGLGLNKVNEANVVHQRAIDVVAQNMADNLRNATQFIGRRVNDVFRRVGVEETGKKLAAGATIRDMKQKVIERLLDKGQTAFVDRLGRKWRLDTYAEMVARTTTREAASVATLNTCQEFGLDLVRITTHYPTCEKCAPLQGKVFSISSMDKRYPKLTDERRPPIHCNCRHVLTPYVRELDDNAEETEKFSNQPLDKDPRSEAEKQAYKEMRDAVTIATNRKRAREILLNENVPLDEKIKAVKKLKKSYVDTGKVPRGTDASLLKQYENYTNEQKYGIIKSGINKILEDAAGNEPQITQDIQTIVARNGGRLEGLDFRLKSKESLEEKIMTLIRSGNDAEKVLSSVYDAVRYTNIIDKEEFTSHYFSVINGLEINGYKVKRVRNTWTNIRSAYKGINVILEAPSGQMLELQFHTPESFDMKQNKMHKLYEEYRKDTTTEARKLELENEMLEMSKMLEIPVDIEKVSNIDLLRGD